MRTVQLDFQDPSFPARLADHPDPPLPDGSWARVAVTGGGICGSDLHIFKPTTGPTPVLMAYGSLPLEMGHEIAGTVVEAGPDCPVAEGTRVAVDPVLGCLARGIDPPCERCVAGATSVCRNLGSRVRTPGMSLGFTNGLGAGWGDQLVAHHTQLHEIPDGVSRRAETLHEPLSIGVHGLLRVPPSDGPVLVVGAGIIGLLATCALRALFPDLEIAVVAKYRHQEVAARACGATEVVGADGPEADGPEADGPEAYRRLAEIADTELTGFGDDLMLAGGFPYVIEAVGSPPAVTQTLRCVDHRGHVLLLGASGVSTIDLTPVWFKEASVSGSYCHARDTAPGGGPVHSIDQSLDILAGAGVPAEQLVTHEFPLGEWRQALETAMARDAGAIKVVLRP